MGSRMIQVVGATAVVLAAAGLGIWAIEQSTVTVTAAGVALLAMLVGSVIAPSVSSRNRLTLAIAAAAAVPFIFVAGDRVDLSGVVGVYLLGAVLLAGVEFARVGSITASLRFAVRRLVAFSTFAFVFASVRGVVDDRLGSSGWEILIPFILGALAWVAVDMLLWSLSASLETSLSMRYLALSSVKDVNVFISLIATGGLFGLMYDPLDWWALPVALLPYSFAHGAFRRFQETKSTYRQTIRALAQIPEVAGLNLVGHSDRTAALAVAMAKDLGLSPEEVEDVEFAALMHDIGHITLNDPTVVEQGWTDDDLARWGAELIAGAPSLDRVSGYVRRQYEPFRKPGEESDPTVPTVARIVKIASAFDAHRVGSGLSQLEALEELHRGAAYEYDPEVVASLRRVLDSDLQVNA
ncbi:MAG TPA: HD domain-containing phosphohydrolase [Acidimicrobiia bacterium]|nr:HD domain-containing phosphohydrolase [Acidimicrobiia bacterium]